MRILLLFAEGTLLIAPAAARAAGSSQSRPNIVVVMADDMGFSNLGCYGGEIRTPHLDRRTERGQVQLSAKNAQYWTCLCFLLCFLLSLFSPPVSPLPVFSPDRNL